MKGPRTFWEWRRKNRNLVNINYFTWCILKNFSFYLRSVAVMKISGLTILTCWFITQHTLTFTQIFTPWDWIRYSLLELRAVLNPVFCNFPSIMRVIFLRVILIAVSLYKKMSPQLCKLHVVRVSSRTDACGGTACCAEGRQNHSMSVSGIYW